MGPIRPGALSAAAGTAESGSPRRAPDFYRATAYSTSSNRSPDVSGPASSAAAAFSPPNLQTWTYKPQKRQDGSAFALPYILRLRSCRLLDAFLMSPPPPFLTEELHHSRAPWLHGHYPASPLLRTPPPPSRLRPTSRGHRLYGLPCSTNFLAGRGGLLQLLGMSLPPCRRYHPAGVNRRLSQLAALHAAFALRLGARPPGLLTFGATCAFTFVTAR
jgi:hypothetical protein